MLIFAVALLLTSSQHLFSFSIMTRALLMIPISGELVLSFRSVARAALTVFLIEIRKTF